MKKILRKETLVIIVVLLQVYLLAALICIGAKTPVGAVSYSVITYICVIYIINSDISPAYKLCWAVPMLLFPVYGGFVWILLAKTHSVNIIHRRMKPYCLKRHIPESVSGNMSRLERRLNNKGFPVTSSPETRYFPMGEQLFEEMLGRARSAQKYIFIEFFIIAEGKAWDMLLKVLSERAENGVDVRIVIDGAGSVYTKPYDFKRKLARLGIKLLEFNPISPHITGRINFRDHRKIFVVDGKYAFTCGINISDEYMNYKERFGVWKDTGIMVSGSAAWSFTVMFLEMWGYLSGEKPDTDEFRPEIESGGETAVPFSDTPLDDKALSLDVYMTLINSAEKSVFLTTPYLVCDEIMLRALCNAAESGVDVRLIMPHIPDKRYVNILTRGHYARLLKSGVRIFEFRDGFIHSKTMVIDGERAVVGTVNFDYRSFYLLFECAVLLMGGKTVSNVEKDFIVTQSESIEIADASSVKNAFFVKITHPFLKLIAPLL